MPEHSVLIVDDEPSICFALQQALTEEGYETKVAATAEDALNQVQSDHPDVIVMDVRLPGMDGLDALQQIIRKAPEAAVIIMTAFGDLRTAVTAINRGAFEYITKPFDLDDAIGVVRRACRAVSQDAVDVSVASERRADSDSALPLLGTSPAMQTVFRRIALVAEQDVPVLITGESGTGKELVAEAIHRYSRSSQGPFIPVCVPAMSPTIIESELFGHQKGAFTGADQNRTGLLELAEGGTAFLDEIGDIPLPIQVKLLRVLESRVVTPVGRASNRRVNFRLIAATNCPLEAMVESGAFREDLFYRLNVFRIEMPPLRERVQDIALLARHFAAEIQPQSRITISLDAMAELESRPWQGNVRELRNAIEHAAILARGGEILPEYLPPSMNMSQAQRNPTGGQPATLATALKGWWDRRVPSSSDLSECQNLYAELMSEIEPDLLQCALKATGGNRQEAARILGIHRQTFREKLKRYGSEE